MVSVCLPSDALSQCLLSALGFSYLGCGVSVHGCSSKAQPQLLTLDLGYLLTATTPNLGRRVTLHGHHSRPWTWGISCQPLLHCAPATPASPSVRFSRSVMSNSLLPMNHSMPGLPVHHQLPEFTQTHVRRVGDAIQPSHPLSSPSPPAPSPSQHQSLFQ